jgi:DsbC/DsbD-like thiol-disulfide interchange protein
VTYRARLSGPYLVVEATLQPGWHTFAIDNQRRADEKLAGRKSLGIDRPTDIKLDTSLAVEGGWHQSSPKDFSKPEIRWFSFGFEQQALFVAKVRRTGAGPARIGIRGQACTETTCKNIDVELSMPLTASSGSGPADIDLKSLVPVR